MALIETDTDGSCKLNGPSTIYGGIGTRRQGKTGITGKMQPKDTEYSTDGLPKAFLHSLRTLFDILDDGKRGYVHISEIESRWQGADTHDLSGGVLECLRLVAPPHGCLTFERFVAGLRYSMPKADNNNHIKAQVSLHPKQALLNSKRHHMPAQKPAPLSTCSFGTLIENNVRPLGPSNGTNTHHKRASSLQSRSRHNEGKTGHPPVTSVVGGPLRYTNTGYERTGRSLERITIVPESGSYRADSVRMGKQTHPQKSRVRSTESLALESSSLQKSSIVEAGLPRSQSESATGFTVSRRHGRSRDEQRRHTITNGVDYGMLKQMKELEQEKDSLLAGLGVVERAREWYQTQIHNVTERQRHVGQSNHCTDSFAESQNQSHRNVLLPKLQEVNRCLNDLISCSGVQSFPSSSSQPTVISSSSQPPAPPQAIQRLKDQNRLLIQEVTDKGKRITQLEQEKSALIKQLFEARARSTHDSSTMDSTFI
ncbi:suppressor APC domain-containing protein 2-like isoform X1 [Oncorhynchus keta]|uniref:suppressor APC domain-containing protein 2-like isoform X1 n=1 Tax=Oncorhynchus keta TaxID=8018 RepID=UPI0015F8DDC8|nr:suppressor APC domain-containing protein 2-like isoform X1 [Oncorhynchus keta]